MKLENKIALVTGGSRGNGRAIAIGLAREGADVAVNYNFHEEEALSAVKEIEALGRRAIAVQADTSKSAQVNAMVQKAIDHFGRIDILVNNAGVMKRTPFFEITEEEWDWLLDVDLKGYFLVGQAVARGMAARKSGAIVNVSSAIQIHPSPNLTHYGTAKGGVIALSRQMAFELAPFGIRVNTLAPGLIETDINRKDLANPEFRAARLAGIPLRIIGEPEDLAAAAVYLASDEARMVTGANLSVDGGVTMP